MSNTLLGQTFALGLTALTATAAAPALAQEDKGPNTISCSVSYQGISTGMEGSMRENVSTFEACIAFARAHMPYATLARITMSFNKTGDFIAAECHPARHDHSGDYLTTHVGAEWPDCKIIGSVTGPGRG